MGSRLFLRLRIFRPSEHVICSPGGVATTALLEYCSQFVQVNIHNDSDGLKHLPSPRIAPKSKFLFVSGSTRFVIASLRRRGYVKSQMVKLSGNPLALFIPKNLEDDILRFLIRRQRKRFTTSKLDILIIRDENLWRSANEIADFLGVPNVEEFTTGFPINRRER